MFRRSKWLIVLMLLVPLPVLAEQPDLQVLQRAVSILQAQRNQAQDSAAAAEVKAAGLADDLAKAQARIKELESKPVDKKD